MCIYILTNGWGALKTLLSKATDKELTTAILKAESESFKLCSKMQMPLKLLL